VGDLSQDFTQYVMKEIGGRLDDKPLVKLQIESIVETLDDICVILNYKPLAGQFAGDVLVEKLKMALRRRPNFNQLPSNIL
jgi:hypothetical protein